MKRWTIGVLIHVPDGFYFGDILWGISREAKRCGVSLLVVSTAAYNNVGNRIDYELRAGWALVDAWIVVAEAVSETYLKALASTGRPIVSVAENFAGIASNVVKCDNYGGGAALARHLIETGRTRAAFAGKIANADYRERLAGFADVFREAGYPLGTDDVYDVASGREAAERLLADGVPVSAIFVSSDYMAAELIGKVTAAGIRVPDDLAVVGFDDSGIAKKCRPNLTTVRQPIIDLGVHALRQTVGLLTGACERNTAVLLPAGLVVRESSGAAAVDASENVQSLSWRSIPGEELEQLIESHRRVGLRLIDAQDMSWLRWTNQHWGCVALWTDERACSEVTIDGSFSSRGDAVPQPGERFAVEAFPPMPPLSAEGDDPDIVLIQQVRSDARRWGLLVTAGPVNERFVRGYDTRQFPSLLGAGYDHRALLEGLAQREAGYAALAEKLGVVSRTTNDGVYELDLKTGRIEWIGGGIESILGVGKSELPADGPALQRLFHPDDVPNSQRVWAAHIRRGLPFRIEVRVRRGDGYVWVSSAGEAVYDGERHPVRFIGSITDIHQRKNAEAALVASEERYRAFFHNTPVMMLSLDDAFAVSDANPYWLDTMGYTRDEVIGTSCLDYMTEDSVRAWKAYWQADAAEQSGIADMELRWTTRYGRIVDGLVNGRRFAETAGARIFLSVRDITERKRAEKQIHYLAYHDSLTGLPNRRLFNERLAEALRDAAASGRGVTVMVLDLDHFKVINDSLGHDRGDLLLRRVASLLEAETGGRGVAARIGGDEFMVLVKERREGEAFELADRIVARLQQPFAVDGYDLYATASIGISRYPDNGVDGSELVKMADTAMYRAKELGRNRYEAYSRSMEEGVRERLAIGSRLRLAADTMSEFRLFYQPQIDVETGRLTGMEALLRWTVPEWGSVPPGSFVPLAEETGLIVPIGGWVLREACRQMREWDERFGRSDWHMSVNLSARQLQQPEFLAAVDNILYVTGVSPARLIFEITETAALHNLESCVQMLNGLRDRGAGIALDDFGTGYSSLLMLKELPLSVVKIDRSFIRDILDGRSNGPIVSGIIAMSKELGMSVIAEGVEEEAQLELLRRLGCDRYQGYYASKPVPPDEFERAFLEEGNAGRTSV